MKKTIIMKPTAHVLKRRKALRKRLIVQRFRTKGRTH